MLAQALNSYCFLAILAVFSALFLLFVWIVLPPQHPKDIPAVPFWVTLLPFFYDVDQEETYWRYLAEPLQNHGAVKIFVSGQWNLLVHKPSFLTEMFRKEDIYQKCGNHEKIPHTVLADFLGDNIIANRGDDWKLYRKVMNPGLQRDFDTQPLIENAERLSSILSSSQKAKGPDQGFVVQDAISRYTTANVAGSILQTDIGTLTEPDSSFHNLQTTMRREIFKPMFMNFPILDQVFGEWLSSRLYAREVVERFSNELQSRLLASHAGISCKLLPENRNLGSRLIAARDSGAFTQKQFRDNLNLTITAGQENPQLALISTMYLLAKYPQVQQTLRENVLASANPTSTTLSDEDKDLNAKLMDVPYLTATIYESLRLLPPISQLINRRTAQPTYLGDSEHYIPAGTYVGYNGYSTHRDPTAWGADACDFKPERWAGAADTEAINKMYRARRVRGEFISFHGGKRACLGEKFAMLEMRVSLAVLLQKFEWKLDEDWQDRKTPAGPLYPRGLKLVFKERKEDSVVA